MCAIGLLGLLLLSNSAAAQEVTVLKAARMLDVESGQIINNAVIVIKGGRITAVNPGNAPEDAKTIDLGNLTLLPGFIDAHVHLTSQLGPDSFNRAARETATDSALKGVLYARRTLLAGFTTVRNTGADGFADVALMRAIDRGFVVGPRIIPAAHSLSITGGHGDASGLAPGVLEGGPEQGIADGADQVIRAVRYQIKHGAKVIKTTATAGVLSFEGPVGAQQYSYEELKAMVEEAARHGIKVAAHAHGTEGIIAAVRAGVASIEHGSMLNDEAIALMKEKGTYLVPTTYLADQINLDVLPPPIRAKAEFVLPYAKKSVENAIAAGVKIAFGTDAAVFPHGDNAKEFAALVERGMTPLAAIRSSVLGARDLLGTDDRGTIAEGKLADIIAIEGNPLEDITATERVRFVMKGGKVYKRLETPSE